MGSGARRVPPIRCGVLVAVAMALTAATASHADSLGVALVTVRDMESDAPLAGVRVKLNDGPAISKTDSHGFLGLGQLSPGLYEIEVSFAGYIGESVCRYVRKGESTRVDIHLFQDEARAVSGVVRDTITGEPIVDVRVHSDVFRAMPVATDERGRYLVAGLKPDARLRFEADGYVSRALTARIGAGETSRLDVDLYNRTCLGRVAGRVTDKPTGEALQGTNVMLDGTMLGAATDANGDYGACLKTSPRIV